MSFSNTNVSVRKCKWVAAIETDMLLEIGKHTQTAQPAVRALVMAYFKFRNYVKVLFFKRHYMHFQRKDVKKNFGTLKK